MFTRFLPAGSEWESKEFGALQRLRRFSDVEDLLCALLIQLLEGCSGRETSVRVQEFGIAQISDVAFLKRLAWEDEWLRWMAGEVMGGWVKSVLDMSHTRGRWLSLIAATHVQRPGSKALSRKIHYAVQLPSLLCDGVIVSGREV
jgi:hypothetical protein